MMRLLVRRRGCKTPATGSTGAGDSSNTFIRFHFTGSLELLLLALDDYAMTQDAATLLSNMPMIDAVLTFFRTRFPHRDPKTGKTDMFPAQALETHQCPDPTSRTKCATNPSTDVSGLRAVLTRLLALPKALSFLSSTMRAAWQQQLDALPELQFDQASGAILPVAPGYSLGDHNSENTELYPVHPFRIYGSGKPGLDTALSTYKARKHPCNNGWCQDVVDAAMLGLRDDAKSQVLGRAQSKAEFRFAGFAGHMQDYEPSADHFSFMRTAMHYMVGPQVMEWQRSTVVW